jgi:hypothetical protein
VRIWAGADGDDGDGDDGDGDDGNGDGVGESVKVIIVPEALRQVGWLRQH